MKNGKGGFKQRVKAAIDKRNFTRNLAGNYGYRTVAITCVTFAINAAYAAFNIVFAAITLSVWYASLGGYYLILSLMRGGVIAGDRRAKRKAAGDGRLQAEYRLKNYRICGCALFVLEVAMAGAVTVMIVMGKPTKYSEVMAIVFAAYTTYKVTLAIVNIVKAKKQDEPQVQAIRNIGLADAAISLLSLQTALIATFSDEESTDMTIMNALMGAAVCIVTICIAIIMIVNANVRLKKLRYETQEQV
ncbi:MAG: hypothetical protein LUD19_01930 [Clostridia bacterium]|nr:hypothetical protein [Clostridia bacterium]